MKLNLLPTYVSKEGRSTTAAIGAGALAIIGVVIAIVLVSLSTGQLAAQKENEANARTAAESADAESKKADAVMNSEVASQIVRNINLAAAMEAHSTVYPDLYDKVVGYIPPYFRLTSMSAAPAGEGLSIVTLGGVVGSYQEYADLMLALLRIPGASSVSRSGYQLDADYVPSLTPDDQVGRRIKPGQQNIPDDPIARMNYFTAQGSYTGYAGVSNFGGDPDLTRGPMPGASLITVTVTVPYNLMTPDPRATLSASGGSGASASLTGGAGAANAFGPPGGSAATGAPTAPAAGSKGGSGKRGKGGDDE